MSRSGPASDVALTRVDTARYPGEDHAGLVALMPRPGKTATGAAAIAALALLASGCVQVLFRPGTGPETAAIVAAAVESRLIVEHWIACRVSGKHTLECVSRVPRRITKRYTLPGVRSAADVKMLRSGQLCAPVRSGGVRCLGRDFRRAIGLDDVAPGSRAIFWDDGYCVLERNRRQFRCEWFDPHSRAYTRRVIFFEASEHHVSATFPGGVCVCSTAGRGRASCIVSRAARSREVSLTPQSGESAEAAPLYIFDASVDVFDIYQDDSAPRVCDLLRAAPAEAKRLFPEATPTGDAG